MRLAMMVQWRDATIHEKKQIEHFRLLYFFPFFAFFAAGFSSSAGALRLPAVRVLLRVPSVGGFFSFLGALASLFFPVAFLPLLALGFSSSFSPEAPASFVSASFLDSDFA